MAELDFILQAVTTANHAEAIRTLLALPKPTQILISVAFVRELGLDAVEEAIKPLAAKTKFFIGIRNDITSIQAIKRLLAMKVELYAVDTGSRNTIFHPKLYFATNAKQASIIIGSANLTFGGLHNNIEASTLVRLDLCNPADTKFAEEATSAFAEMLNKHPQHVFLIKDEKHADELFESGRLANEEEIPAPSTNSSIKKGERDSLHRMKLYHQVIPKKKLPSVKSGSKDKAGESKKAVTAIAPSGLTSFHSFKLMWESKELSRRDLNIPEGTAANRTGSIGLGKGKIIGIDQRHYFRDVVFDGLTWKVDKPSKPHLELADAKFDVVIKNINYGQFQLFIRHNTDMTSKTYEQDNELTHLRWGNIRTLVAKEDLLERTLRIYRKDTTPPEFMIEID